MQAVIQRKHQDLKMSALEKYQRFQNQCSAGWSIKLLAALLL